MSLMIGIDLGTTNSAAAIVDKDGCRILQNRENEQLTRSAVTFYKGDYLVGRPAFFRWLQDPKNTIISVKRIMGRGYDDPVVIKARQIYQYSIVPPSDGTKDSLRIMVGGKELSPVDVSALILRKIKADAEYVLGAPVSHAVITVPAYFSEKQKYATRLAGQKAGLAVMKIIDEPTAAAVAFGISASENEARTLLVFDLGGGTFDISVIMMCAGDYYTLNLEGDMWLGGDNFDQLIMDYVLDQLKPELGRAPAENARFMAALRLEAQKAKETLSSASLAQIFISGQLMGKNGEIVDVDTEISREQFEALAQPLIDRTIELVKKAVTNARLELSDIDYVIMAGNATGIPKVQQAMEHLFGKERVLRKMHPKFCVAMGAAITASVLKSISCPYCNALNDSLEATVCSSCGRQFVPESIRTCPRCGAENDVAAASCFKCNLTFVNPDRIYGGNAAFSYGIQTAGDVYNVFIHKNDSYPTEPEQIQTQAFKTAYMNQRIIMIPVYGGDDLEVASRNEKQGEAMAILPPWLPAGTTVKVRLWLDKDGTFDLQAHLEDGTDLKPCILRGQIDQKVMEIMEQTDEMIIQKENSMPVDRKKQIYDQRDQIYEDIQKQQFSEAIAAAEQLKQDLEAPPPVAETDVRNLAQNIIGFCAYLLDEYDWLLGTAAYSLNQQTEKLRTLLAGRDLRAVERETSALEQAIEQILDANQLLNLCIGIETRLAMTLRPVDPAQADALQREFKEILQLLKSGAKDGVNRLTAFTDKLMDILQKQQGGKSTIICKKCGTENPLNARVCRKCKQNLRLLDGHQSSLTGSLRR